MSETEKNGSCVPTDMPELEERKKLVIAKAAAAIELCAQTFEAEQALLLRLLVVTAASTQYTALDARQALLEVAMRDLKRRLAHFRGVLESLDETFCEQHETETGA